MKRLSIICLFILSFIVIPHNVDATSVYVSCSNVIVGGTTECVIRANSEALETVEAKINVVGGVTLTKISAESGFTPKENDVSSGKNGGFSYLAEKNMSGSFIIAKITIRADSVGPAAINLTEIEVGEGGNINQLGTKSGSFSVSPQPTEAPTQAPTQAQTQPPTTNSTTTRPTTTTSTTRTTKKTNQVTSPTETTTNHIEVTSPILEPLKLLSLSVDKFPVKYENNAYYVTTESYTESVTINATAEDGVSIVGTGTKNLTYGKNVVELILRNASGQTNSYQVIIMRPDDANNYDTKLTNLKVVDYPFAFSPNKTEYTIKVPYNVDEIYVIAETLNKDYNISGAGLKTLTKGKNKIYIKVSYGELDSTNYVITVKRSYSFMILIIGSGMLGLGLIAALAYAYINRKAAIESRIANNKRIPTKVVSVKTPVQTIQTNVSRPVNPVNTNADNLKENKNELI